MDNASNCNKTAEVLPNMISTFAGEEAHVRCFSHILHLIAQVNVSTTSPANSMFMSFFFRKRKSSKKVKKNADGLDELIDVDEPDNGDEEDDAVALKEIEADDAQLADDDGYVTHGKAVVYSMHEEAIRYMEAEKAISLDKKEINEALGIMPKVAGLARHIHDSGDLKERFDNLVSGDSTLDGSKRTLDRRVPTCWNSDHACLQAHQYFRTQVEQMIGLTGTKLRAYALSERQWKISDDLVDALRIFEEPTRLFSNASVPLIVNVIPAFDDLRLSLEGIRDDDDEENNISPVMRVAAHAALMMVDKYETMSWECPIYYVAIVMCPDRKMQWLKNRPAYDWRTLKYIKDLVIKYFEDKYQTSALPGAPTEEELRSHSQQVCNPVTVVALGTHNMS
ncbi:hypothetical protein FA13DRAFT_1637160 [Coprinellus micaceus]|uniref:hAT-like transposase RNase-H fold domain-containing protein n=1 Tax=Coprinellus micaceus TaxID=71717 RepID=A0A4Y7SV58_COPMI|nr:hypothetical protein FA13DRAFT_1637160 [Coprinellus micaceus]